MKKQTYITPAMTVVRTLHTCLICASDSIKGGAVDGFGGADYDPDDR